MKTKKQDELCANCGWAKYYHRKKGIRIIDEPCKKFAPEMEYEDFDPKTLVDKNQSQQDAPTRKTGDVLPHKKDFSTSPAGTHSEILDLIENPKLKKLAKKVLKHSPQGNSEKDSFLTIKPEGTHSPQTNSGRKAPISVKQTTQTSGGTFKLSDKIYGDSYSRRCLEIKDVKKFISLRNHLDFLLSNNKITNQEHWERKNKLCGDDLK